MRPRALAYSLATAAATLLMLPPAAPATSVSLSAPTSYAAGDGARSIGVGDFNGDSDPDLAVVNSEVDTVSLLLGAAGGSFVDAGDITVGVSPRRIAVADFNGDLDPDLAVTNFNSGSVSVLFGQAGGGFGAPETIERAPQSGPSGIATGDFDGDSHADIAITELLSDTVSVFLGGGDGSFGSGSTFGVGDAPFSLTAGDFNSDGDPDLMVVEVGSPDGVAVLMGQTGGSFEPAATVVPGVRPQEIAVGDFNGDSHPDAAVAGFFDSLFVLLGQSGGAFGLPSRLIAEQSPIAVAVGDFNADSASDLVAATVNSDDVAVLLGDGAGSFGPELDFAAGQRPASVAVADFNDDARPDIAVANFLGDDVSVLLNTTSSDAAPPALTLPGTLTVNAAGPAGRVVTYSATATDAVDGSVPVTCTPASGSTFAIGTTTVICLAADAAGNEASGSFSVVVKGAAQQIADLSALVKSINLRQGIANSLDAKLQGVQDALAWIRDGSIGAACNKLDAALNEISAQAGKDITVAQAADLIADVNRIRAVIGCA